MKAEKIGESLYETLYSRRGRRAPGRHAYASAARGTLKQFLAECASAGLKIRGARGNRVKDVIDLLEAVRKQQGISLRDLYDKSGVAKSYYQNLKDSERANPSLEVVIRLAMALDFEFELVELGHGAGLTNSSRRENDWGPTSEGDTSNSYSQSGGYTTTDDPYTQAVRDFELQLAEGLRSIEQAHEAQRRYETLVTTSSFAIGMTTGTLIPHVVQQGPNAALTCAIGGVVAIAAGQQNYPGTDAGRALTGAGAGLVVGAATYGVFRLFKYLQASMSSGSNVPKTR